MLRHNEIGTPEMFKVQFKTYKGEKIEEKKGKISNILLYF